MVQAIKEYHPGKHIVLAGDLNRNLDQVEKLALELNMHVLPPNTSQGLGHTRGDKRLDYILITNSYHMSAK